MSGVPAWRQIDPTGLPARLIACCATLFGLAALAALVLLPVMDRLDSADAELSLAKARADRLEAAATQAADTTRAGTGAEARAEAASAARAWLAMHVTEETAENASLRLLSTAKTMVEAAGATLTDVTPLGAGQDLGGLAIPENAPLRPVAVTARVTTDHAGLAAILEHPLPAGIRIVALDIAAATTDPLREEARLDARLVFATLRLANAGETN